jgi:hypothetical protein
LKLEAEFENVPLRRLNGGSLHVGVGRLYFLTTQWAQWQPPTEGGTWLCQYLCLPVL